MILRAVARGPQGKGGGTINVVASRDAPKGHVGELGKSESEQRRVGDSE